jgi:hypothetical protein
MDQLSTVAASLMALAISAVCEDLSKAGNKPLHHRTVFEVVQATVEFFGALDGVHGLIVIEWIRSDKVMW